MEVMYAETSNAVMGALLVHDIRNMKAPCRGDNRDGQLHNALELFSKGSFHGGTWRCAYKMGKHLYVLMFHICDNVLYTSYNWMLYVIYMF